MVVGEPVEPIEYRPGGGGGIGRAGTGCGTAAPETGMGSSTGCGSIAGSSLTEDTTIVPAFRLACMSSGLSGSGEEERQGLRITNSRGSGQANDEADVPR